MSDIAGLSRAMKREGLIVWIDMEMTGLSPETDRVIEIATIITDGQLSVIAEGPEFVIHQPSWVLEGMDDWNRKHHGESGLVDRVAKSKTTVEEAESETLRFISQYCEENTTPLAGNSIHQDRRFIARYMPELDHHLHYRMIDVSTVKELAKRWYPDIVDRMPRKKNSHRALDDIRESIDELRLLRRSVFR
jgi:oligoribonuclease